MLPSEQSCFKKSESQRSHKSFNGCIYLDSLLLHKHHQLHLAEGCYYNVWTGPAPNAQPPLLFYFGRCIKYCNNFPEPCLQCDASQDEMW